MLTLAEIKREVARVEYRPGWTLEIQERRFEGPWLRITAPVLDARTKEPTDLGIESPMPPFRDLRDLLDWVLWRLERVENHECREWFRYRGEVIFDPHEVST